MPATYDDARLVVQILRWSSEMGLEDAAHALFASSFDASAATTDNPAVRKMLAFGETISTLAKHDVLNAELIRDLWWLEGMWSRVGPAAARERERLSEPRLYENFDAFVSGR